MTVFGLTGKMFHLPPQRVEQAFSILAWSIVAARSRYALAKAPQLFAQFLLPLLPPHPLTRPVSLLFSAFMQFVSQAVQLTSQPMQFVVWSMLIMAPGLVVPADARLTGGRVTLFWHVVSRALQFLAEPSNIATQIVLQPVILFGHDLSPFSSQPDCSCHLLYPLQLFVPVKTSGLLN